MPDCPYDLCDGSGWIHTDVDGYPTSRPCPCKPKTPPPPPKDTDRKTAAGGER